MAVVGVSVISADVASAAVFVHCPADNLQTAITNAPSGTTIIVDGTCVGNFTIPAPKNLTLNGPAVLDGNNSGTVLAVASGATAKLVSITVQHGNEDTLSGGGIRNEGTLTVQSSTVADNTSASHAGGIFSNGTLTVTNSTVVRNVASGFGGGLTSQGTANISNTTIEENEAREGGGLWAFGGSLTLVSSNVRRNTASVAGGGLGNLNPGASVTVKSSAIADNTATGTVGPGIGGGMSNNGPTSIAGSTFTGNRAKKGGGMSNTQVSNVTLKSSTVSGNTATDPAPSGGGVFNQSSNFTFPGSSIAGNTPDNCVNC